jgi:uncharacterized protein YjbJ (UPF0337 family)
MHQDEIEGSDKQTRGTIKDVAGALTGDEKLQAEGKSDKAAGKLQSGVGQIKEAAREALKK